MERRLLKIFNLMFLCWASAQTPLSNLHATKNDPLYTTYAAQIERSEFTLDEGYHLVWYDDNRGIEFETDKAGSIAFAFKLNGKLKYKISSFYEEPIVDASYSDLVKLHFYPFKGIKIAILFLVYSSRFAIWKIEIENELKKEVNFKIYPFIYLEKDSFRGIVFRGDGFVFSHREAPDKWTIEHKVPYVEHVKDIYIVDRKADSWGVYPDVKSFLKEANVGDLSRNKNLIAKAISVEVSFRVKSKGKVGFKLIRGVYESKADLEKNLNLCSKLFKLKLDKFIDEDEKIYSKIPKLKFRSRDYRLLYWGAFNLLRQCMLPPEGRCSYNYYVFSREPQWGWGHGGQVFHESLSMLAYVFMDPVGAMNSQRVYIERQWGDGYINYRTGPYLDETIPYNGQYTSSAPWFNWENWEIYKVTGDRDFLLDAYRSGVKFYNFWVKNRDRDGDGLCEWGGHAVLESVRDGYVAVWDEVGWPSNFEALDLNCMLVVEARSLAMMARELGYEDEFNYWMSEAEKRGELINRYMWDEKTGFYYHVDRVDHDFSFKSTDDLKRKEIIGFLPLWAEVADSVKASELIKHLTNPDEFWRRYGVPTLSADDSYYNPHGYWNGPVWVEWEYLVFRGFINYGFFDLAEELARRVLSNVIYNLKKNHWFWELYSPDDNWAGWHKTYIWAGIVARFLIDLHRIETDIKDGRGHGSRDIELNQSYPDPFKLGTVIIFDIPKVEDVRLEIYDVLGRRVKTLVRGLYEPGRYKVFWDGRDDSGRLVASGVYFYRLIAGMDVFVGKMVVFR